MKVRSFKKRLKRPLSRWVKAIESIACYGDPSAEPTRFIGFGPMTLGGLASRPKPQSDLVTV